MIVKGAVHVKDNGLGNAGERGHSPGLVNTFLSLYHVVSQVSTKFCGMAVRKMISKRVGKIAYWRDLALGAQNYQRCTKHISLEIRMNIGIELSWIMTEKKIRDHRETSYKIPIKALPRNQNSPKPALKRP